MSVTFTGNLFYPEIGGYLIGNKQYSLIVLTILATVTGKIRLINYLNTISKHLK